MRVSREPLDFYLVRHGEADPRLPDPERPLTTAGRNNVARLARAAAAKGITIDEILHSGILRAEQTAEILAEYLFPPRGIRAAQGLGPQDDPILQKADLEGAETSLMLVGHLPYMSRLIGLLVSGDPDREIVTFSPASLVCCRRESSRWKVLWTLTSGGRTQS